MVEAHFRAVYDAVTQSPLKTKAHRILTAREERGCLMRNSTRTSNPKPTPSYSASLNNRRLPIQLNRNLINLSSSSKLLPTPLVTLNFHPRHIHMSHRISFLYARIRIIQTLASQTGV